MTLKQLRDSDLTPVQQTPLSYRRSCAVSTAMPAELHRARVEPEGPAPLG